MNSKEALESWFSVISTQDKIRWEEHYKVIKKDLEVLEIIKNKEVVIGLLKGILHSDLHIHNASYYNSHFVANYRHLTQEEFDLVKEWLSNE